MSSWRIAALLALLAAMAGCAGTPPASEPANQAAPTPASVTIGSVEQASHDGETRVTLKGNFPFSYTSYEPDASSMVLELLDVDATPIAGLTSIDSPEVESLETTIKGEGQEGGKISQVTFHFKRPTVHQLRTQGNDLVLVFQPDPLRASFKEGTGAEVTSASGDAAPALPEAGASADKLSAAQSAALEAAPAAKALLAVVAKGPDAKRTVQLKTDGKVTYKAFELSNPSRLVVDLEDVMSRVPPAQRSLAPKSDFLGRVRVAQFATAPQKIARVVFDLKGERAYEIVPGADGLLVDFSDAVTARKNGSAPATLIAAAPEAKPTEPALPAGKSEPKQATAVATPSEPPTDSEASSLGVNLAAQTPEAETPGLTPIAASTTPPERIAAGEAPDSTEAPSTDLVPMKAVPHERVSKVTNITSPQSRFAARTISDGNQRYTGKKISLNFKDADLKDVFRIFHEISGYNIVLDPSVSGNVTIVLENVPEDQALDIILKNNGLDKIFENNVIRIASTTKLSQEAAARKTLQEAKELEEQPTTFTRALSYARAKDVAPIVKRIMSKRGDVSTDDRTNTLIISDIAAKRDPISRLIDSLDEQTPQVSIEARIVETDRQFERDLGVTWGMNARFDPSLGTQTGLQFPHTADISYDVNVPPPASANTLGINFGNVLNSFNLNMQLDAFELSGDVKILSAPKVVTQNNQTAVIEQGTQIPIVNTTATEINVEFVSASLRLEVTPQITKEGTVSMLVKVENNSPNFVNRVGDVPPINTQRAQTQIMVGDGGTAVIGGIFKVNDAVTETGVPGLRKIPGLGWLFKSKTINRENAELLIFITPRILKKV
ncbi:MAG TPA: type IV pilus secretin PilQ [Candidatus Polarisedimenticolia bacterium]|nr:type IV pilus secretin PilQ [Candidatus Polarisedimenticolia bacterium]